MDNVTIDWTNHRMVGYVRGDNAVTSFMDIPLISPVDEDLGLYQGGCRDGVDLGGDFDVVVSLYKWERYDYDGFRTDLYEFTAYDSSDGMDDETLFKASDAALKALDKGRKVLIHCQAGLNRSGLVSAFTLMRRGMPAQDAIDLLRNQRTPLVLCNSTFVKQLHAFEHRRHDYDDLSNCVKCGHAHVGPDSKMYYTFCPAEDLPGDGSA